MSLNKGQRFLAYGLAGWCSEILSTGIRSRGRDANWRLTGHTYLWMLPIYGVAAFGFEPAHNAARAARWPWWRRAAAWTAGIYVVEAASGELLRAVTGEVPWDYSRPRGRKPVPMNFRGLVRPAYAPVWFWSGSGWSSCTTCSTASRCETRNREDSPPVADRHGCVDTAVGRVRHAAVQL